MCAGAFHTRNTHGAAKKVMHWNETLYVLRVGRPMVRQGTGRQLVLEEAGVRSRGLPARNSWKLGHTPQDLSYLIWRSWEILLSSQLVCLECLNK